METKADRLLKRVWLINGVLVLLLGTVALGVLSFVLVGRLRPGSEAAVRAPAERRSAEATVPRAIRYSVPQPIRGTSAQIVTVHHGLADQPRLAYLDARSSGASSYYGPDGPLVNIIFLIPGSEQGSVLLDHPAYIKALYYPRPVPASVRIGAASVNPDEELPQTWISYEIVDQDTNHDGKLDGEDRAGLFLSALDGSGLRRIVPAPFWILAHNPADDRRSLVVLALEPPKGATHVPREQMRQRAFLYDLATGALQPHTALESAADRVARIVGR